MTYVFLVTFLKSKNNNLGELLKDLSSLSIGYALRSLEHNT